MLWPLLSHLEIFQFLNHFFFKSGWQELLKNKNVLTMKILFVSDDASEKCETLNKRPVIAIVDASPYGHGLGAATTSAAGGVESSDGDSSSGIVADAFDVTFDTATCSSSVQFDSVEVFYFEREQV
jgi:hypothetical protein